MCGIIGFLRSSIYLNESDVTRTLRIMTKSISHRGPNSVGFWYDIYDEIALGHRRLAILDLTDSGHQPMLSDDDRYVMAFNGEIYNHLEIRQEIENSIPTIIWKGHSDTETLLKAIQVFGWEETLQKLVGMFAIALWDQQQKELTLARDRMGEKPLYWGWSGQTLLFGSELKALKAHPAFNAAIDRDALALLLRYNYIPAPYSIYGGIEKLLPGHFVKIKIDQAREEVSPISYWSLKETVEKGVSAPFTGSDAEAIDLLEHTIKQSLVGQMAADVPLGAFLSGGVDSSTVVALMQAESKQPIKTFAIGFDEPGYNEAEYAKAVAEHLGTEHTEFYVTAKDALEVVPLLSSIFCEPFADSSQIPTYLVSKMAKQHVTVALSGDAGDELFGGYNTYQLLPKIWKIVSPLPTPVRKLAAKLLSGLPMPEKLLKLVEVLPVDNRAEFYNLVISHWKNSEQLVIGAKKVPTALTDKSQWSNVDSFEEWMMSMDAQQYMVDDILVKVDRAAMANSLEVRVPMLDHRVVELAWQLPIDMKIRDKSGKWVLREVLYKYVPKELIERPKKGFSIPLAQWLRGPLREWAEPLLAEKRLTEEGYFYPDKIRKAWKEHLEGHKDNSSKLWSVLMFQSWLDNNIKVGL
ncbi:asparagine synthase (glutamine-hydrolyzing) [Psychrobacter pocilloporae]|uniref:asparagine synthase (glutamine-hydrolyzing) n=1 Tax=Psychrobacter pocilloporae TaxID=1775882 RepID=A0ABT6IR70_9GAMM|nr:asparagine synthase (glutamine-hydrolyzing) [Psychrobacter pocilloporae]MDH4904311.1 asparagine synthase (glutamine-hydrolyzing) [Psychrobacter pocilloporae]